jgi:hypothetical protein
MHPVSYLLILILKLILLSLLRLNSTPDAHSRQTLHDIHEHTYNENKAGKKSLSLPLFLLPIELQPRTTSHYRTVV